MMLKAKNLLPVLCLLLLAPAVAQESVKLPSGIDFKRMRLIDKELKAPGAVEPTLLEVHVNMVGIGDKSDARLLVGKRAGGSIGTTEQINQKFVNAIEQTKRFKVFTTKHTGVGDKSIRVEGMVVTAMQQIQDFIAVKKPVTTIRLSINIVDTETGRLAHAKTITGTYGDQPGEGDPISPGTNLNSKEVQDRLENNFEQALMEALDNAAEFIKKTYRPIGKVLKVDNDEKEVKLYGGSAHGILENDTLVVFRSQKMDGVTREDLMDNKPIAIINCENVNAAQSTCAIKKVGKYGDIQPGDYAVVGNASLRLTGDAK